LKLLEKEYDRRVAYEDVKVFDLSKSFGMSYEEIEDFMVRAHEPDVLASFTPLPGALDALQNWADAGFEIDIMTGRPPSTRACSEEWLGRYSVHYSTLNFVDKYHRRKVDPSFAHAMTLADLAKKRYRLAVEDSAATAIFLDENEVAPVYLIDRPWNRKGVNGNIRRMANWGELAQHGPVPDDSSAKS
jgi:uncharacterized HAD superfamily protein